MLFFVVAMPGRFGQWCQELTVELVQRALGPTQLLRADSLEEISVGLMGASVAAHTVIASTQPSSALRGALVEAGRKFVVVVDDPWVALGQVLAGGGADPVGGTRAMANSCAANKILQNAPAARVLAVEDSRDDPERTALAISDQFDLPLDAATIAEAARQFPLYDSVAEAQSATDSWSRIDVDLAAMASATLLLYRVSAGEPPSASLEWGPRLFFRAKDASSITGSIDITGRPRRLLFGPQIMVEPGAWSLFLSVSFSPETADHDFLIEVSGCEPPVQRIFKPPRGGGTVEGAVEIAVPAAAAPLDIRLSSQRAAFDGTISLNGARLTKLGHDEIDRNANDVEFGARGSLTVDP